MTARHKHLAARILAGLLALALAGMVVDRCLRAIVAQEEQQVEQTLQDVGEQNAAKLRAVLDSRRMLLAAMCVQMSDEEDTSFLVDQFKVLVDIYNVKRIGFADLSGQVYTTDGVYAGVAHWDVFRRAAAGETLFTDVTTDTLSGDGESINLCAGPVYRDGTGELMGVMFAAYRTETFSRLLQVGSFTGQGTSCIFQRDGLLVAAAGEGVWQPGESLFDLLNDLDAANAAAVAQLRRHVLGHDQSALMLTVSNGQDDDYLHVMELDSHPGWYLTTIVPTAVLTQRTQPMLDSVRVMIAVVTALLLVCVLVYLWTYHVQQKALHRLAYVDPITGGDNYAAFCQKMTDGRKVSGPGYVVSADLRDFDSVNNTCGVQRGNEVIRAMHGGLTGGLEKGELCARVSADRFLLFLHAEGDETLVARLKLYRDQIAAIAPQQGIPPIMPKFGARAVTTTGDPERAYRDVNVALRRLSVRVDYFYAIYNDEDKDRASQTHDIETRFDQAIAQHRFEMWYQPKYEPRSGRPVAAEALVRWRQRDGRLMPPGKFIPLFERNGMIAQLDEYTFRAVCAQQRFWLDRGKAVVPISVNLSRVSLLFPDIAQRLARIAQSFGLETRYIELEITESAMEGKANLDQAIGQLREVGFHIQIDDFGSGYSSLSTLTRRCFDNVKLDKSLVDCIGQDEGNALIESITGLVHRLGMTVTAEGVEREEQMTFLRDLAVDNIQGYYYSKPLTLADFEELLG